MTGLRKQGLTYKEIARELGVALQTVAKHMQAKKLGGRRKKVTPEVLEEMKKLRAEGMSHGKIAGRLGLTPMTVYNHLRKRERHGFIERLKRKMGLR